MKKLFYLFFAFSFVACNDKHDAFLTTAPPTLLTAQQDTLRIREKDYSNINGTNNGRLVLYSPSPEQMLNIQISDTSGKVHIDYRGVRLIPPQPLIVAGDSVSVFCSCDMAGIYNVDFSITDHLGRVTDRQVIVKCLANVKAIPALNIQLVDSSVAGNWVYSFDASSSYKLDGIITSYHYNINGQTVDTNNSLMNWTFHAPGLYTITLYETDDLGQNSDILKQKLFIP